MTYSSLHSHRPCGSATCPLRDLSRVETLVQRERREVDDIAETQSRAPEATVWGTGTQREWGKYEDEGEDVWM